MFFSQFFVRSGAHFPVGVFTLIHTPQKAGEFTKS